MVECAQLQLGTLRAVADHSWTFGESLVLEVEAADQSRFFLKEHRKRQNYNTELRMYQELVPQIQGAAPVLLGAEDSRNLLMLTAVPGTRADVLGCPGSLGMYRRAGEVLRQFHSAASSVPVKDWAARQNKSLENWIRSDRLGALRAEEIGLSRLVIDALPRGETVDTVWTHRDWRPRNWIVGADSLYVIDFEHARREPWLADVAKLWFVEWDGRPHLRNSFFEGYGRHPSAKDEQTIRAIATISHVSTIVWASHDGATELVAEARAALGSVRRSTVD